MSFISGLANCHLPGLFSMVLSERVSSEVGMRRVFMAGPDCRMQLWETMLGALDSTDSVQVQDYRLKPHNHHCDVKLTLLRGSVYNWLFDGWTPHCGWNVAAAIPLHQYRFGSALTGGQFELVHLGQGPFYMEPQRIEWGGVHLKASAIHTVVAYPGAAWLVEEGREGTEPSYCYSLKPDLKLDSTGLYQPMGRAQLDSMYKFLKEKHDGI